MMTADERSRALTARLEKYAGRHPTAYQVRLALVAALGYIYLLTVMVGLPVLLWRLWLGLPAIIVAIVAGTYIVRAFASLRWEPPGGLELSREDAPALWAMVDEVTDRVGAPRVDHLLLGSDVQAGALEIPRRRILGGTRSYLSLGLPLMLALSPEELRAVVAHEVAHLSRRHGRIARWVLRVRYTWSRPLEVANSELEMLNFLITPFMRWYVPFLNAHAAVLRRRQERQADQFTVDVAGEAVAIQAHARIRLAGRFWHEVFWPDVWRRAGEARRVPTGLAHSMADAMRRGPEPDDARVWLDDAMREETDPDSTHPSFRERMAFFGVGSGGPPPLPEPLGETAAERYLGELLEPLLQGYEENWRKQVAKEWYDRWMERVKGQRRLAELERGAATRELGDEELGEHASLAVRFGNDEAATPVLRKVLARQPEHRDAAFHLGRLLLQRGDAEGMALLERVMAADGTTVPAACAHVEKFLRSQGRDAEAAAYRDRGCQGEKLLARAGEERSRLCSRDGLLPHGLPDETVWHLLEVLAPYSDLICAYLARKEVTLFPEKPCYVLGVNLGKHSWASERRRRRDFLREQIEPQLGFLGDCILVFPRIECRWLAKRIRKQKGAVLFAVPGCDS